jgi:hypothetical protein
MPATPTDIVQAFSASRGDIAEVEMTDSEDEAIAAEEVAGAALAVSVD